LDKVSPNVGEESAGIYPPFGIYKNKAVIQFLFISIFWIPACAGMTYIWIALKDEFQYC
jgi:hypothetical protein